MAGKRWRKYPSKGVIGYHNIFFLKRYLPITVYGTSYPSFVKYLRGGTLGSPHGPTHYSLPYSPPIAYSITYHPSAMRRITHREGAAPSSSLPHITPSEPVPFADKLQQGTNKRVQPLNDEAHSFLSGRYSCCYLMHMAIHCG